MSEPAEDHKLKSCATTRGYICQVQQLVDRQESSSNCCTQVLRTRLQFISSVLVYRKCAQRNICLLHGKKWLS